MRAPQNKLRIHEKSVSHATQQCPRLAPVLVTCGFGVLILQQRGLSQQNLAEQQGGARCLLVLLKVIFFVCFFF